MTSRHALRIPAGDRDLTVRVVGTVACLALHPRSGEPGDHDGPDGTDEPGDQDGTDEPSEPVTVAVPARVLVAALRAAWADEHDSCTFEPWRDRDRSGYGDGGDAGGDGGPFGRYRWYGSGDLGGRRCERWGDRPDDPVGDLGDGDPDGFRDPTVVPFPNRFRSAVPPRNGLPWEPEEELRIRTAWLAAAPDADRRALLAEIAGSVERKVSGVVLRLRQVGCDPAQPGGLLARPWDTPAGDAPTGTSSGP
ncbi:hypothetical protein ACR9E3_14905 [Actinomycetospora sp. C-140]